MAETKETKLEREYIIPLRREFLKVPQYERTKRAVKAIKKFIAKHMKVADRDLDKVKIDVYFNNELWFRGRANPPSKVKVKATKEGEIVRVTFVEIPKHISHLKAKHEKMHKAAETQTEKPVAKTEEKTEEQKKEEKEKEKSVAAAGIKQADAAAKVEKHVTKPEKQKHEQRMALQK